MNILSYIADFSSHISAILSSIYSMLFNFFPISISPVNIEKWSCEDDIVER